MKNRKQEGAQVRREIIEQRVTSHGMLGRKKSKTDRIVGVSAEKLDALREIAYHAIESSWNPGAMRKARKSALALVGGAVMAVLGGCAGQIGSAYTQTRDQLHSVNGPPIRNTISDNSGEHLVSEGVGPSGYNLADADQSRAFYNGSTPTNMHFQRSAEGNVSGSLFSGADKTIQADRFTFDPTTGMVEAEGVMIGGGAAESTRATNEAFAPLVTYWQARDEASKQAIIEQIDKTSEIPKELAPLIVQLLLGL